MMQKMQVGKQTKFKCKIRNCELSTKYYTCGLISWYVVLSFSKLFFFQGYIFLKLRLLRMLLKKYTFILVIRFLITLL